MARSFQRLAIVNRGEPAVRLIHAAHELARGGGPAPATIALYTEPDRGALYVRESDEAFPLGEATFVDPADGGRKSRYLDLARLEEVLLECRADAAWVGWGFVAERPEFAELCRRLGIVFVGPSPEVMRALGDKIEAKRLAERAGVPVAAWSGGPVADAAAALAAAEKLGYPLLLKAAAGGGGRGIRKVESAGELPAALARARAEALAAFGDGAVFLESLVPRARHVEVQIVADAAGTVWPLGVRDCTLQRRNQKVLEETPSPALSAAEQQALCDAAVGLARAAGYTNAGTVEFLFDPGRRRFVFMEVNTRLQVEHPVTEATTGADLVKLQLHVAAGGRLEGDPPAARGWAIEVRLNAEDPDAGFAPAPGTIELLRLPTGPGVRTDAGFEEGDAVPAEFDSMIAKIVAWGRDRDEALARLSRALADTAVVIRGGTTNKGFLQEMLRRPEIASGEIDVGWLDRLVAGGGHRTRRFAEVALLAAAVEAYEAESALERARFLATAAHGRPEVGSEVGHRFELRLGGEAYPLTVCRLDRNAYRALLGGELRASGAHEGRLRLDLEVERLSAHRRRLTCAGRGYRVLAVSQAQGAEFLIEVEGVPHRVSRDAGGAVRAPAPAVVVSLAVAEGDEVAAGDRLAVVEAMKMETAVVAPFAGRVRRVCVRENVQVAAGEPLVVLEPVAAAAAGPGERLSFELLATGGDGAEGGSRRGDLRDLERLALGYDVDAATLERILDGWRAALARGVAGADSEVRRAEDRLLELYTDVAALFRRVPDDEGDGRRSAVAYLAAYLRDLEAEGEGLPEDFLDRLGRVLGHYGVTRRRRTRRLEETLFRLYKAHRRLPAQAPAVLAILERRLAAAEVSAVAAGAADGTGAGRDDIEFRPLLDRLIDHTHAREPAVHDLAREVRYQLYDRPLLAAARRSAAAAAAADLDALGGRLRGAERERRLAALVDNPQPIEGLIAARLHDPGAGLRRSVRRLLLEALLRRAYRGRELGAVSVKRVGAVGVAEASYREGGRTVRILAAEAPFAARDAAAAALAERCAKAGPGVAAVVELLLWHRPGAASARGAAGAGAPAPEAAAGPDAEAAALAATLEAAGFPPSLERAAVTVGGRSLAGAAPGARGGGAERARSFTFRPDGEGGLAEDALYRGIHPATAERLELWRLSNFDLERLPAGADDADVYLFKGIARDNPRDERLFAVGEVRDVTPVTDAGGRVVELPELERVLMEALAAIRRVQSRRPAERRLLWNRVVVYVWPPLRLTPAETDGLVRRLAPRAEGHGLQKVAVRTLVADRRGGPPRDWVLEIGNPTGRGLTLRFRRPADRPLKPLDEYARRVVAMRRRGLVYPYELIRRLTSVRRGPLGDEFPPPGEFVEHDLDADGRQVPVDRPWGRNSANLVVGLIRNFTPEHPEGMARVIVLGDPSRGMGSLADPECSRVVAALDLAERLGLPVEWFALSAGAEIAMDSGTENMDAIARVLRRIVEFTQTGGEINVVVGGVNVGAQPYWNAEATMLMHTRGVLIMTPSGAMVLTGKKALDYSGGVSAEDNQGIGGYERIMGPNGQAQYFARDLESACRLLLGHYRHAYVAPGERFPRSSPSRDPRDRDVREFPHHGEFATVGEVFSDTANPGRKRAFDIRRVMRAVTDQDHDPLERWYGMEDAEVAVVWGAHLGGRPVSLVGFESKPLPRFGFVPADGPRQWTAGTLFPLSSKKVARAINAASGNRPLVVLANLSGFDGSPESMRRLQLEYGAEIGRAVVNFKGPLVFCVVSRYHGGAFVVFSRALNDGLQAAALEGSYASVIGGAPAAAVVFAREVEQRARRDPRVAALERELAAAEGRERARLAARFEEALEAERSARLREVAAEFDAAHSVERARRVGSIEAIIPPARLRPWLIEAVERGVERELAEWTPPEFEPLTPYFERRAEVLADRLP